MCRLIAIIDPQDETLTETALRQFGSLAETGNIPPGMDKGHKDGWGVAAYKDEGVAILEKDPADAFADPKYQPAVMKIKDAAPALVLGHLRKASLGLVSIENTQPYTSGSYIFCHNGTLRDFEKLVLGPKYSAQRKGTTDSEIVFLFLLQTIEAKGDFTAGFMEGVAHLRAMNYTALNILMSNGRTLIALREGNDKNEDVKKHGLCDSYYTLLQGKDAGGVPKIICSQPLDLPGIVWEEIPNHSALAMNVGNEDSVLLQVSDAH